MTSPPPILVFSDLDGTLLDHNTYDWSPALPAIEALQSKNCGLILASSKTAREIAPLRSDLNMQQWPAIVENGAGLLPANSVETESNTQYRTLRDTLNSLASTQREHFIGFGDMTNDEVATATGLSLPNAALSKNRAFSEPGIWTGNDRDKEIFLQHLQQHGICALQGGRFLTLSYGANKVDQLHQLTAHYSPGKTIALGDAPNDIAMLEAADIGVVITNPNAPPLPELATEKQGRIIRTIDSGPVAWNATILDLLNN